MNMILLYYEFTDYLLSAGDPRGLFIHMIQNISPSPLYGREH